ncbi:exonuclease phage-type/recb c-terminal domain-containing protein [Holotrichia oblita]|uniref:Exonuclease phage-type/recb c-terminal domain-containing protein n=1 Tax=Holotrichia oblita TaxID=644536 RepID=A0ACB9SJP4_HOLOL|nr:exonuclease phage-type/recb c-terminal domain-containing protein [Holotrichia oblita]
MAGFRPTGIYPFNKDVIADVAYTPSTLTERALQTLPETTSPIVSEQDDDHREAASDSESNWVACPQQTLAIFHKTVGQSKNPLWLKIRRFRLTASLFGTVLAACRRNRYPPSLFKKLTGTYNLDGVNAIQWGREHEAKAVEEFTAVTGLSVTPAGIWLDQCGYLGATPDGFVGDEDLLEVKCPFKYRNSNIVEVLPDEKHYISVPTLRCSNN